MSDDEFEIDESKLLGMAQKILMPKLHSKKNSIIILETPSIKSGFFYDMWKKFEPNSNSKN